LPKAYNERAALAEPDQGGARDMSQCVGDEGFQVGILIPNSALTMLSVSKS